MADALESCSHPRRVRPSFARAHTISATTSGSDGIAWTYRAKSRRLSVLFGLSLAWETNARELDAIRPLFPQRDGDVMAPAKSPIDPAWAERVHRSALRILWELPTGVEPGLDASRFEFWKPIDDEDPAPLAADCVVQWVWTSCFARAEYWLCKRNREDCARCSWPRPSGTLQSWRSCMLPEVRLYRRWAPHSSPSAPPSGALSLMWSLEAAATHIGPSGANFSLDISNAFGTMSRTWMQRSVRRHAPRLESLLAQIYGSRTRDSTATLYEVPASWGLVSAAQPAWRRL